MAYFACIVAGLLLGGVIAWVWASSRRTAAAADADRRAAQAEGVVTELRAQVARAAQDFDRLRSDAASEKEARVRAETQCTETARRLDEEKALLEDAKAKLADAFKALSADALKSSNAQFLQLASESFDKRHSSINSLVKTIEDALNRLNQQVNNAEKTHHASSAALSQRIDSLLEVGLRLGKETDNLVTALRRPEVRGRWGEMQLQRVCELSGMSEHCDFSQQVSSEAEGSAIRPDMIIHLPSDRDIVVDAKAPLDAYLSAISADTEESRQKFIAQHAQQIRSHMTRLAGKAYWEQFERAPEMVVMFIPGESFFAAAVDSDKTLIEDAMARRIVPATPTTLIALLKAVAYGWRQEQLAENAQKISELGRQLYDRMRTLAEHLAEVGRSLEKANDAYNHAVASLESRVLPSARRFKELGAGSGDDIPVVSPSETPPRKVSAPELTGEF